MDFNLSEEQQMLRTGARDFLTAEWTGAMVRELEDKAGHSPGLWRKMADLGWVGLALPVEYGGSGASFLELTILLEEMGRALVPSSFFSTVVLGALTILNLGNEEQRLCFLPPIARGEQLWTLALGEPPEGEFDHIRTVARGNGKTRLVNGTKTFVPDADVANYLICVAGTGGEGGRVFPVIDRTSMGLMVTWLPTMAGDRQFEVVLGRVAVTGDSLLGGERTTADVERLVQQAAVAKSAEMVGGCQRALDMAVDHSKQRVQFGRPIGSFQAIQHHCANALLDLDCARFLTYQAAWMLSQGLPCAREMAMAKAWGSQACVRVAIACQQVLGGVGLTREHDMQLYYRRTRAGAAYLGNAAFHYGLVAREMGL